MTTYIYYTTTLNDDEITRAGGGKIIRAGGGRLFSLTKHKDFMKAEQRLADAELRFEIAERRISEAETRFETAEGEITAFEKTFIGGEQYNGCVNNNDPLRSKPNYLNKGFKRGKVCGRVRTTTANVFKNSNSVKSFIVSNVNTKRFETGTLRHPKNRETLVSTKKPHLNSTHSQCLNSNGYSSGFADYCLKKTNSTTSTKVEYNSGCDNFNEKTPARTLSESSPEEAFMRIRGLNVSDIHTYDSDIRSYDFDDRSYDSDCYNITEQLNKPCDSINSDSINDCRREHGRVSDFRSSTGGFNEPIGKNSSGCVFPSFETPVHARAASFLEKRRMAFERIENRIKTMEHQLVAIERKLGPVEKELDGPVTMTMTTCQVPLSD